jgi:dTDP-4-amino-4,6-dideoxygalactose transaminase
MIFDRFMHVPLHKPLWGKSAEQAVVRAMRTGAGTADGPYSAVLRKKLSTLTGASYCLPMTSCTHAMDTAVACLGATNGDEVIVPSFTLASTATAAMIKGATPVFADIDPVHYSLDPADVARKITKKTKGIITVHYAGMAGKHFDALRKLAKQHKLWLVEDAAHCIGSFYRNKHLGTFGSAGALSFHGTKNVACGEGGALVTDATRLADTMEIFRAIGTDRQAFLQGKVSIYQWVGEGSSYFLSDIFAALVNIQLDQIDRINKNRSQIASEYNRVLKEFADKIQLPVVPDGMTMPNWHIYALGFPTRAMRESFIKKMRDKDIEVSSHYVPLHTAPMGKKIFGGRQSLPVTERVAERIVRMPIYAGMTARECAYVCATAQHILRSL